MIYAEASLIKALRAGGLILVLAAAQANDRRNIARLLADDGARESAVRSVVESRGKEVPLLLSWARKPPAGVDRAGLDIGLADVFGKLKTAEAIPFLIKNITMERWPPSPNTWMKTPEVIEGRMPAVAALVQIGPESAKALIRAGLDGKTFEERLAAIFVVSQISNVPESMEFLASALGQANLQRHWAEDGLKLSANPPPR
jgi:HEAT repeat protein